MVKARSFTLLLVFLCGATTAAYAEISSTEYADPRNVVDFLRKNKTPDGMPLSYRAPEGYWNSIGAVDHDVGSVIERLLVTHSVSIYDAALWQTALSFSGDRQDMRLAESFTERLVSGRSGGLDNIRASDPVFRYGDKKVQLGRDNAYFFRIIAEEYVQEDPLGDPAGNVFPNHPEPHHEEWKPVTGEQAWGAIIGPLQSVYAASGGQPASDAKELALALSILPALEAMQAPNGAFYHVPEGTHGKVPNEISNENNFSMYAALRMLSSVLKETQDKDRTRRVRELIAAQSNYFKRYAFDRHYGVFRQGGYYSRGRFKPAKIFAADCQTWGINALGPRWIDEAFGFGTSYRIWKNTRSRVGHFDANGILRGIGFTDGQDVTSVEWTCGAILATRLLAEHYAQERPRWAQELAADAKSMREGIEGYKTVYPDGSVAYWYASKRYYVPWGWWANPIPSLASSAWVVLIDTRFNPFVLGGGEGFKGLTGKT